MLRYGPQELGLDGTVQRKNALERWREQRARDDLEVREEAGGGEEGKEGEEGGGAQRSAHERVTERLSWWRSKEREGEGERV
jgi:hypothetical protein